MNPEIVTAQNRIQDELASNPARELEHPECSSSWTSSVPSGKFRVSMFNQATNSLNPIIHQNQAVGR
jgi:hypothetical protein